MTYARKCSRLLLVLLGATCAVLPLHAEEVGIANTQPLSFGQFVAGDGTIMVGADGMRLVTGGVIALASGPGSAAQFVLTGDANSTYSITLPADGTVTMVAGPHTIPVNGFTSLPASAGTFSAGGSQLLTVGARLDVSSGQPAGDYSGTYMIVVDYN